MNTFRNQILNRRLLPAFRTMKSLPNFPSELVSFIQEESRIQAEAIVGQKEPCRTALTLDNVRQFSYKEQLQKLQKTNPLLVASIVGTLAKSRNVNAEDITRKGFGGANRSEDIDLTPCIVQSASRILRNRHPSSVSVLPGLNSLFMWTNRVPGQVFHWFNSLGDTFRYSLNTILYLVVQYQILYLLNHLWGKNNENYLNETIRQFDPMSQ